MLGAAGVFGVLAALVFAGPREPGPVTVTPPTIVLAGERIRVERQEWSDGVASGVLWRARIPRDAPLDVLPSATVRPLTAILEGQEGDLVAIDGGFYDNGPMGLVMSGGLVVHPLTPTGGSGVLVAAPAPARVVHRDQFDPVGVVAAVQSIDRLVEAGRPLVTPRAGAHRDARSAIAVSGDAVWLVALADERSVVDEGPGGARLVQTSGRGLPLAAFAALLVDDLQAVEALNFDGAVSTQLYARVDGAAWSLVGERGTIDAVVGR